MSSANLIVERRTDTSGVVNVTAGGGSGAGDGGGITLAAPPQQATHAQSRRVVATARKVVPSPSPRIPPREMRETFIGLANPNKMLPPEDDEEEGSEEEESGTEDGSQTGTETNSEDDEGSELPEDEHEPFEDELKPSEGFRTLEEEKADIIFKLTRLKKKGFPGLRQFNVHSDIRDMRTELNRIRTELDLDSSVKFQRKMLMAVVSGLEFANRKYSPFELQLDGWSETVQENLGDYDSIFEQLYFKYRNKVSMPPELSLIIAVGGSALMFHYSNTILKASLPKMTPEGLQNMQAMLQSMHQQQQQQPQQQQHPQQQQPQPHPQPPMFHASQPVSQQPMDQGGRRQMRGPGVDLGALLGGLPPALPTMAPPQPSRPMAPQSPPMFSPPPPPQPPQPQPKHVIQEIQPDDGSERLSDVISEDLQSVPEDLQSISSDMHNNVPNKRGIKNITLQETTRKRGKQASKVKNVVVI